MQCRILFSVSLTIGKSYAGCARPYFWDMRISSKRPFAILRSECVKGVAILLLGAGTLLAFS